MQFNLAVKVLKKSKDAPYPEHIIVERKSTHELAHLYFDNGVLKRLTHIVRDPQIRMAWDEKEKRYKTLLPRYKVSSDAVLEEDKKDGYIRYNYLKGPENQNFFTFYSTPPWNLRTIAFQSLPEALSDFCVEMDLSNKCIPNAFLLDEGVADVKVIFPRQKRTIHPLSKLIADGSIRIR